MSLLERRVYHSGLSSLRSRGVRKHARAARGVSRPGKGKLAQDGFSRMGGTWHPRMLLLGLFFALLPSATLEAWVEASRPGHR